MADSSYFVKSTPPNFLGHPYDTQQEYARHIEDVHVKV